jgi:uroporphyrinogen-III synthase
VSDVPPLAGYTVGVTAERRADEFGALLTRWGATVRYGPAIRIEPLADDAQLRAVTRRLADSPADVVVATTGVGFRGWLTAAEGWELSAALVRGLSSATIVARGPKARGAVRAAGLVERFAPASETSEGVLEHLLAEGVRGRRIAVQLHGEPLDWFLDALAAAGAEVVAVPVYRWTEPDDLGPVNRLLDGVLAGEVDALTFTSAAAVTSVLRIVSSGGRSDLFVERLRNSVLVACVGEVTAAALVDLEVPVVRPERARLGALARTVAEALPARAVRVRVGRRTVESRGDAVVVDGELRPVTRSSTAVLRELASHPGEVVTTPQTKAAVDELRSALGNPDLIETTNNGYRLATD